MKAFGIGIRVLLAEAPEFRQFKRNDFRIKLRIMKSEPFFGSLFS